jgi:predicted ATPase
MIKNLHIKGFKSFTDKKIPLSGLTLLTGLNNSGKSSIIQALRMYSAAFNNKSPLLDGHGSVAELQSKHVSLNDSISISLHLDSGDVESMTLHHHHVEPPKVCPEFFYIGADRLGPQAYLPLNVALDERPKLGDRGEYVFDFISRLRDYEYLVPDALAHPASEGKLFEYELKGWLSEIAPGVNVTFEKNEKADIAHAEFDRYRPANVGFGLSYTLPIIAAILGSAARVQTRDNQDQWVINWEKAKKDNGVLLVLENPEAHLHPKGQTAMGKMIALAASCGVQIVVETHSEHVMDGIRIAVKETKLSNKAVVFHYLSKDSIGITQIHTPQLDPDGKLDAWPEGFFDQTLKNRAILAKKSS